MTTLGGADWLPIELRIVQPYSMGPLTRWDEGKMLLPAMGTVRDMDSDRPGPGAALRNELAILLCLVAPMSIQRDAQRQGVTGIIMRRVKGLREALGYINVTTEE